MIIRPIKTRIISDQDNLIDVIDLAITHLNDKSIVCITSKVIALTDGRTIKKSNIDKNNLIEKEADLYIKPKKITDFYLTIKNNILIPSAGIDESNAGDNYILWPENAQVSANKFRAHFVNRFKHKNIGVLITDSTTAPLRVGVRGIAISHSGFLAVNNYIGKPDMHNRKLKVTKVNVIDSLAAAAVFSMGEGNEQTPIAIIEDCTFVQFQDRDPIQDELNSLKIPLEQDLFAPLLNAAEWSKS
ncbi:hypothetical protein A3J15_01880 [Candidatus Roizmanbacteria bacterium RIFCSPLOWO2_02_FULL_38_10]|uniref:Coenzyme F420:L-glutamate ligase-like domain-containing protein n=1 Tax=Candidatus Roizmanbacteria bacterium RIFCSPLOWO2_02_FULL_38_10 TaxID=1802074 RepID=A0A1F7JKH8_9BACT|nr:MAG: hypothetical protein A3J15_01880 [Candidatus Roizmanbacteria bacterium RIFCSPLOWO2_02_FULL_38_10]